MSKVLRRRWPPQVGSGLSRRDRRGCDYEPYVPDRLVGRSFRLDADVAADVADAERAIIELNRSGATLMDIEALARLLLRAESVASSFIEGLAVGARRLLRAEAAHAAQEIAADVTADEVLGNVRAMAWAVSSLSGYAPVTVDGLLHVHALLLEGSRLAAHAGRVRDEQNWIGGSSFNPCSAAFVPPPPEHVGELLEDLCAFVNDDQLPATAQAAIAHAQFETIHPFIDGNGRTGRALIHVILRRRGLADRFVPPVSLVLATQSRAYVDGLSATRYRGSATSRAAHEGVNRWIALFAAACRRAVEDATTFESEVEHIGTRWRADVGRIRRGSAVDRLLAILPGAPVLSVGSAATLLGCSFQAANEAMRRLEDVGIVRRIGVGRRNRAFEAPAIVDEFTELQRRLSTPALALPDSPRRRA